LRNPFGPEPAWWAPLSHSTETTPSSIKLAPLKYFLQSRLVRSLAVDAIPFGRWVYYAAWLKPQNFVVCVSAVGAHATDVYQERYDLTRAVLSELSFTNKVREDECAMEDVMGFGRGLLLWLLGIPLPIIILLAIFMHH
jgi:hypothetical protein